MRFCSKECHKKGASFCALVRQVPKSLVDEQVGEIHRGLCPICHGRGPIDVHMAHRIYSALIWSSWRSIPNICCRACGIKSQFRNIIFSLILGWWGLPWGVIMTPVQISRNIFGMMRSSAEMKPSANLENLVRRTIASQGTIK